jgi:TatA/E family protein of Tat protein translocase
MLPMGPGELLLLLIVLLVVVLLWRGPKTLPRLGEAFGQGVRAARRAARDDVHPDDTASRRETPDRS